MPAAANRQRQLILADEHDPATEHLAKDHFVDLGRLQGIGHEDLQVFAPPHDVNPLSAEFLDDVLDTVATHAHACPNTVDATVGTDHRHLAAVARLAGDRANLDHAVSDFGNLLLEKPLNKLGANPRQNDLHPTADLPDLEDRRPDPFIGVVALAGNLLGPGQDCLRGTQRDRGGGPFDPRDHPRHHLADLLLELVVDRIPFGFANLLDDHLLGGLGADAAREFGGVDLGTVMRAGEAATGPVDRDGNLGSLTVLTGERGNERCFDRLKDDLFVDVFVAMNGIDDS